MMSLYEQKITADHRRRAAYLYVRQSTLHQVMNNTESTRRQYALRERAITLGWPLEAIVTIDEDLGQSGSSMTERKGFQRLVSEVGLGHVGIVMGLEVSRLARNSADWHRLLEICAWSDTLILDEDGLYDPRQFNDRLLLGLKGAMSEAELHVLRARMRGGILNKARRGELRTPLPVGFMYDEDGHVRLDADQQVQHAITALFTTFAQYGSALATVKEFRRQSWKFPRRLHKGPHKGELFWDDLHHSRVLQVLHNPRYAGAFVFGRTRTRQGLDGKVICTHTAREDWVSFVPNAHAGYISLEAYEDNQRRLRENAQAQGEERRRSPPREGPALLQGLVICGRCGNRMTIRYHARGEQLVPTYVCQRVGIERGEQCCQHIPGLGVEQAISQLVLETMTPVAVEMALQVQRELHERLEDADKLRAQQVERARYAADLARRRFMKVDPENRLVADCLEAEWNAALHGVAEAQETYDRGRHADRDLITAEQEQRVRSLAEDFGQLWTLASMRDRKRMLRLLIEDVTFRREAEIVMGVRFRGGAITTVTIPLPLKSYQQRATAVEVIGLIDELLNDFTDSQIAALLNERGWRSGTGQLFTKTIVERIRSRRHLSSRAERLRAKGFLTLEETAKALLVSTRTVKAWEAQGLIRGYIYNERNERFYEWDPATLPAKFAHKGQFILGQSCPNELLLNGNNEV